MVVLHIWTDVSRWPTGLEHALCSKNIVPLVAAPFVANPAERLRMAHHYARVPCARCERIKGDDA